MNYMESRAKSGKKYIILFFKKSEDQQLNCAAEIRKNVNLKYQLTPNQKGKLFGVARTGL